MNPLVSILILLPALVLGSTHYYYVHNGNMVANKTVYPKTPARITLQDRSFGHVTIEGSVVSKEGRCISYNLAVQIGGGKWVNNTYRAKAICMAMNWDGQYVEHVTGAIKLLGDRNWQMMNFSGYCQKDGGSSRVSVDFLAHSTTCQRFPPPAGGQLAQTLIGLKGLYPGAVLQYATTGVMYKYTDCDRIDSYKTAGSAKPGFLIQASDMSHCAVVDKEGDKFVQVDPDTGVVVLTPMAYIKKFFPGGYKFLDYSC